jgi:hypothetical protein
MIGVGWAFWRHRPYQVPRLHAIWLAFTAFLPQLIVAYLPPSRHLLPDWLAAFALSASLVLFLAFAWLNRHLPGIPILLVGLMLNLIVIVANGGWMPISPETASHLVGNTVAQTFALGSRLGQKDILLASQNMRLAFLADRFLLPSWFPYKAAFSLGDVFIAVGILWLLAKPASMQKEL